jgi:hypothetical protein
MFEELEEHWSIDIGVELTERLPFAMQPRTAFQRLLWHQIQDCFIVRKTPSLSKQRERDMEWIMNPDSGQMSLNWICEHLEIPASAVRRAYLAMPEMP